MLPLGGVSYADLAAPGQSIASKLEIYDGAAWVNMCDLGGENYLKSISLHLGGAGATPDPIAASWSAEIHNADGIFHPFHPTSAYNDLMQIGRKIRISAGGLFPWAHFKKITLPPPTANLTDFPAKVPIIGGTPESIAIGAACLATGYDIRFTAADGKTLLPYERESFAVVSDAEHIVNGGFDSDTADWTPQQCTIASVAGGKSGKCLELTRVSDAYQYFQQTITGLVIGKTYKLSGYVKSGTSGNEAFKLQVGTSGHTPYVDGTSSGAWTKYSFEFTAIATSYEAWIYKMTATAGTMLFDSVSLKLAGAGEATGIFWVKTSVATAGTYIWCYYGNAAAGDVSTVVRDTEFVVNGGFDSDAASWVPWDVTAASIPGGQSGNCLEITRTGADVHGVGQLLTGLSNGLTYEFSGWVKSGSSGDEHFQFEMDTEAWVYLGGIPNGATSASWVRYYGSVMMSTTLCWFIFYKHTATPGTMLGDSFSFQIFHSAEWSAYKNAQEIVADGGLTWGAEGGPTPPFDPVYWQRLIGYMDQPTFNVGDGTVSLQGGDYMKCLAETALYRPSSFWGDMATFSSVLSVDVLGSELYVENSAVKNTLSDFDNMTNWTLLSHAIISSQADDEGSGDLGGYNAMVTKNESGYTFGFAASNNVGSVTAGKLYKLSFWYKRVSAGCTFSLRVLKTGTTNMMGTSGELSSTSWTPVSYYFTATTSSTIRLAAYITGSGTGLICRFDLVSIKEVTSYLNERYPMPEGCNGVYAATLNGVALWYGDTDPPRGWLYDPLYKTFYFADGYYVTGGTNNLLVYYYTTQDVLNVLADTLVVAAPSLYANRTAALAALNYIDPAVTIDKTWFEDGTWCLEAVRKMCERCGYRFWMAGDGKPQFLPAPTFADEPIAHFELKHEGGLSTLQDRGELRNSIVIQGIELGAFSTSKDKDTSRMRSAAATDAPSIAAYQKHTHVPTNDLFQGQASLDAAAVAMLAAFKDPKWYADLSAPYNAIPLELGDTIGLEIPLTPGSGTTPALKVETRGIIRDIALSDEGFSYKVELESGLMNIANYTQASSPVTVSTEQCKGWVLTNAGATAGVHLDLPAAVAGMKITVYVAAAYAITVDPNGTDQIMVLTGTAGDYLASDATIGTYIVLGCLTANKWQSMDRLGTWTEE